MAITSAPDGGATLDPSLTTNPQATVSYGGTGVYGNLSYADAVQQAYRDQQARMAATGIEEAPIDYSMAGLDAAGLWGMSQADRDANAARVQTVLNDPNSTQAAKDLVSLPGYGTPEFDKALNDGSNPTLLKKVQNLLSLSTEQHDAALGYAPTGSAGSTGTTSTGTSVGTQATGSSSGGTVNAADGGSAVNRLIDLAAMMYGSAGVKGGGGSGFSGLVSGPIGTTATGDSASPSAPSRGLIVLLVVAIAGLGYWYYKKHKKGHHA